MKARHLAIVAALAALTIPLFAACGGDGENGGPGEIRTGSGLGVALVAANADLARSSTSGVAPVVLVRPQLRRHGSHRGGIKYE